MDEKKKKKPMNSGKLRDPRTMKFVSNQLRYAQAKRRNELRKSSKNVPGVHYYSDYCLWSGIHPEQMINPDENSSDK